MKYNKLKIVVLACVLFPSLLSAQSGRTFFSKENMSRNWSVGAALGVQTPFVGESTKNSFGYETTPLFAFFVGKQLNKIWHTRVKLEGFGLRASYGDRNHDTGYLIVHADVMPSLFTAFGKKEYQWDLMPYVGLGYYRGCHREGQPVANMMSTHFGLKILWKVQPKINLFVDGGIAVLPDGFDRYYSDRNQEGIGTLMLGVSWKFGKQNNK